MNLDISESVRAIQSSVREFCARDVGPAARRWDEHRALPDGFFAGATELGLPSILIPEALGGAGLDLLTLSSVLETVARHDGSAAVALAALAGPPVALCADRLADPARSELLSALSVGGAVLTHAVEAFGAACDASREGDAWRLRGALGAVPLGARATHVVVFARTPDGHGGFVVPTRADGVLWGEGVDAIGLRAAGLRALRLDGVVAPDASRLRAAGDGGELVACSTALDDLCFGSVALGLGEGALSAATAYAKDRRQFGKPIAELQAIQWMLADSRTELDAARALVQRAAAAIDGRSAAMARRASACAAGMSCHRALQVHGGYGYTREFPVERALRDARMCALEASPDDRTELMLGRELSPSAARAGC